MYRLAVFNILPGNDFISEKLTDNVIGINTSKIISVSDGTDIKIYISPRTKKVITVSQSVATVLSYLGYQSTSRQLTLTRDNNSTLLVYTEDIYYAYSKNERTVIVYFDGSRMTSTSLKMTFTEFINEFNEIVASSGSIGAHELTYNHPHYDTAYTHSQSAHAPNNAEQNVNADWNAVAGDAEILNKPSFIGEEYESVSKNINSYPYALTYGVDGLDTIVYDLGGGLEITKTYGYVLGVLTTIVLSGDTPGGIDLTKTFHYTGVDLTSVVYS